MTARKPALLPGPALARSPESEPALTRGEYWLLKSVAEYELPLGVLWPPRRTAACENCPPPGLGPGALARTLRALVGSGHVELKGRDGETAWLTFRELCHAIQDFATGSLYTYGLTAAGGAAWEAFAAPDWGLYLDISYGMDDRPRHYQSEIVGADEARVWRQLEAHLLAGYRVQSGSIRLERIAPWQATYWKSLPAGHRLRFDCTRDDGGFGRPWNGPSWAHEHHDWVRWR